MGGGGYIAFNSSQNNTPKKTRSKVEIKKLNNLEELRIIARILIRKSVASSLLHFYLFFFVAASTYL